MKRFRMTFAALLLILVPAASHAFGPATHIGESMRYLELLAQDPLPGPRGNLALLSDPANLPYFQLGATFPDIGRMLPGRYFEPHDKGFAYYVYEKAIAEYASDPWKLAFGVGYLMHIGGDTSSQVFLTPRLAIRGGWGELSVVDGLMDDHPGGENEVLVEVYVELRFADLSAYFPLVNFFLFQSHLTEVLDFYNEAGVEYFGPPPLGGINVAAQKTAVSKFFNDWMTWTRLYSAVDAPEMLIDMLTRGRSASAASFGIDMRELERLLGGPTFTDPDFWNDYPDYYQDLGPTYVRQIEPGENWYGEWPSWDETVMKAGSLESLTEYRPDLYSPDADVVVYDLRWTDGDGAALTSVDAADLPEEVRCTVTLFATADADRTVTAKIKRHLVGVDHAADPVVATNSISFAQDPYNYSTQDRAEIFASFDPAGTTDDTWGYVCDLESDAAPGRPFFTTDYEAFYPIDEIDILGIESYRILYDMYDKWPRTLRIAGQDFPSGLFVVRGKVRDEATGRNIAGASVTAGRAFSATASVNGYYEIGGLAAGEAPITASAVFYATSDEPTIVTGAPGDNLFVNLTLAPVAEVFDEGDYTAMNQEMSFDWQSVSLAGTMMNYEAAAGTVPGGEDLALWTSVGKRRATRATFFRAVEDGQSVYGAVRICKLGHCYPARSTDGIIVDASPPEIVAFAVTPEELPRNGGDLRIGTTSVDPHSDIALVEVSAGRSETGEEYVPWTAIESPAVISIPAVRWSDASVIVRVRATNGAGLSSVMAKEIPVAPKSDDDSAGDDADDTHDFVDDDSSPAKNHNDGGDDKKACGC